MTTPALDALRALLPLLAARDEDRAVTGVFDGDTLNAIEAALALIDDDDADDAGLRHESEKAQLRAEIDRLQSHLAVSGGAFSALEAVAAEARRNDAIAMSWIAEAKHAIGYDGDMPGFIEALRALKADPWPTIARGMITPAHIAPPCKAPPPPNDLEASIRDRIARFAATDDLAKDAADAVLEIVRPLAERSDRLDAAEKELVELRLGISKQQLLTKAAQRVAEVAQRRADKLKTKGEAAEKERDAAELMSLALRAKVEAMERQRPEPAARIVGEIGEWVSNGEGTYSLGGRLDAFVPLRNGTLLYALPGAKGEEK